MEPGDARDSVLSFVPSLLLEQARAGLWPWFGEFRNVTVLFLGLKELDVTHPGALGALCLTEEILHRVLRRHGGSLLDFATDEKGIGSVSAFGLPQSAHRDDAERAVAAAMELVAGLREMGIVGSVGVTAGRGFYGDCGGPSRRRLGLVGPPIILAARLMSAAQGTVLCDERVRRGAPSFTYTALPPMNLKGQDAPVAVFEPGERAAPQALRYEHGMVGRRSERERIASELERLRSGLGGLLSVTGEAGIGKSHLLAETAHLAQERGLEVLTGIGSEMETATPYFPWRRVLGELLPRDPAARVTLLREQLRDDPLRQAWLPLLEAIVPLGLPPTDATRHMDSAGRALAIQELLIELLSRRAAQQPVLLVLDDLHWIDAASCALLEAVHDRLPQLLIVLGSRPAEQALAPEVGRLLRSEHPSISLGALDRTAVAQLACARLEIHRAPPELVEFLWVRANGHPFYIEELLLGLRSAQMLEVHDGACRLNEGFHAGELATLPTTLQGLIVGRVDRLASLHQWMLKLASVIGREFAVAALADLRTQPASGEALEDMLASLVEADLLRLASAAEPQMYEFKHAILRDVLYDLLPFSQRRELHGRVAVWIESSGDDLRLRHAELALHWERAGDPQRAVHHLEGAGVEAVSRYANRDAIVHLAKAKSLSEGHALRTDEPRLALWEGLLGDAHHELFEYASAARHFHLSLSALGRPTPKKQAGLVLSLLREFSLQGALRLSRRTLATKDTARAQRVSHIHERLAEIAYFDNRPAPLLYHTLASLNLAERSGAVRETVDGYAALSIGYLVAGMRRLSLFYNQRSLSLAQERGTPADLAYAHLVNMVYRATIGDWNALDPSAEVALPIYRQLGAPVRWHQTQSLRYHADCLRGRFEQASTLLDEVQAEWGRDTPAQVRSWVLCSRMNIALACGEPDRDAIETLAEVLTPELHRADRARSQGLMAQAWLRLGEPERALACVDDALTTLVGDVPTAWHITDGLAGLAETCIALWLQAGTGTDTRHLRTRTDAACSVLGQYVARSPVAAPRTGLVKAQVLSLSGRTAAARKTLHRALTSARVFDMPHSEARALHQLALLESNSTARAGLLDPACALFAKIGAHWDLEQARRA